jgi:hypothetical protein
MAHIGPMTNAASRPRWVPQTQQSWRLTASGMPPRRMTRKSGSPVSVLTNQGDVAVVLVPGQPGDGGGYAAVIRIAHVMQSASSRHSPLGYSA